jgi:hypothetical protein
MSIQLRRLILAAVLVLSACATVVGRPTITQLTPDPPVFLLALPLVFAVDDQKERFEVPSGFVTDLASIPRTLWWWQGPHEATMAPAIIHDFLYWEQPCTKDQADAVMYIAMRKTGMSDFSVNRIYDGVRTNVAERAWDANKQAKARGERRFFSNMFSMKLARGIIDPKATLASIQADATRELGTVNPVLPFVEIREVCVAATKRMEELRSL